MSETLSDHPIAAVFPLLDDGELAAMADDIRDHGLHEPVWIFEGKVLDGRNRLRACGLAGVEPKTREFDGDRRAALALVWSANNHRRHQDPGARAASFELMRRMDAGFAGEVERMREEAADRKSQAKGRPRGEKSSHTQTIEYETNRKPSLTQTIGEEKKTTPSQCQKIDTETNRNERTTAASLAKAAGTNRTYLAVASKLDEAELGELAAGRRKITDVIREQKRESTRERLEAVAAAHVSKPTGLYDVIVIDPPWPMEKIERDCRPNQSEMDYPTMSEEELSKLEIPCDSDCHVWLWTTHRFLPMAMRLLEAWNLKYTCTFVWRKPGGFQPIGLPQYNCEFAIYARRGRPQFLDTKAFSTCFEAPRCRHSEKPEEFYEILRRVTGGRRLDMFNRREIEGFDRWGNEA